MGGYIVHVTDNGSGNRKMHAQFMHYPYADLHEVTQKFDPIAVTFWCIVEMHDDGRRSINCARARVMYVDGIPRLWDGIDEQNILAFIDDVEKSIPVAEQVVS